MYVFFTYFLSFSFLPSLTMMHLCITQCTYWTPLLLTLRDLRLIVFAVIFSSVILCDEMEYQLLRDLMRNYDPRVRPSLNTSESLNVTFGLALAQIIDVVRPLQPYL